MQERPLLELRLSGCLIINLRFPSLLPYIQFLTFLKLTMWKENKLDVWMENGFDMRAVLTRCGSTLQVLHIRTISMIRLDGPWIPKRFPTPLFVEPLPERWRDHTVAYQWNQGNDSSQEQESEPTNVLALRELVLERASFYLNSLEALLCFTPHLDTLRLIELYGRTNPSPLGDGQRRLIAFLQNPQFPHRQILPLRSYTFSLTSIVPAASTAASIANVEQEIKHAHSELCPDANEWTFFTPDLSPLLKFLEEVQNVVTTLELRNDDLNIFSPDPVLHRYLCASPHLLHLRAENTLYLVDLMDIHGWMEMTSSSTTSQGGVATPRGRGTGATREEVGAFNIPIGPPGIWACKNLQILHIYFCSASGIHFYPHTTPKPSSVTRKISSRIVFGYLSRVCLHLHDLRIQTTEYFPWAASIPFGPRGPMTRRYFSLTLDLGFCLLARLRHLEYLSIASHLEDDKPYNFSSRNRGLEPVDLDWMLEKKECRGDEMRRSKERREARRMVVEKRWETWLAEEEEAVLVQKAMDDSWWINRTCETVDHATFTTTAVNGDNNNNNNNRPPIWGRTDPGIHEQLKDLGLLVDVKNMIDEMDIESDRDEQEGGGGREDGYKYWPMLRWMRMYHSTEYGRSREREVKRMLAPVKELKFKDKE